MASKLPRTLSALGTGTPLDHTRTSVTSLSADGSICLLVVPFKRPTRSRAQQRTVEPNLQSTQPRTNHSIFTTKSLCQRNDFQATKMGDKKTTREAPASLVSEDPSKAFEEAAQNSEEPNVGHEEPYLESDGEEDDAYRLLQNPIQPKKITQQKRADEAAFDQWREKDQQKINGAAILTMNILESTNGFTQANEFRRIINSPREYQTDLFERAKQKNTIVVLDTGD